MISEENVLDSVKEYYGKKLSCTKDLETQACISSGKPQSKQVQDAINDVHEDVAIRYYGCGLVIPEKLEGMKVLDLGSGSGRDCFALSKLVGQDGFVTGIDMTDEQLNVATKYIQYHTDKFDYKSANVKFVKGYIEKLTDAGIQQNSLDIIISNCTVNLSPDKRAVLYEAYKVLKVGGELYFSDIYADRDLPDSVRKHEMLWGEGMAGALWWKDLYCLAKEVGFSTPRLVTAKSIHIDRPDFKQLLGDTKYASLTYRLFKLPDRKETRMEVIYKGKLRDLEDGFPFDHKNYFRTNGCIVVDKELATFLSCSRFENEFDFKSAEKYDESTNKRSSEDLQDVDPFQYIKALDAAGQKTEVVCCGSTKKERNKTTSSTD